MTDFSATKAKFHLPAGLVYLDGNSLGPLPIAAEKRVAQTVVAEWGEMLVRGWNGAGWMEQPGRIGDRIARLIGAEPGTVMMGDTLSIKVYQALASALELNPDRNVVLSDNGNFPSDLYIAQGLLRSLGRGLELKIVDPGTVETAIDSSVAVLMLTEVDYRTGRLHDMRALTRKAHEVGALTVWDLAHSAGALPVRLADAQADFAVGCTYKYLNGGPGSPAFIYVAPCHTSSVRPALSGWMGHEAPFAFDLEYRNGSGIERMRVGTPPVIALAALEASLDVWDGIDLDDLRQASIALTEHFISSVEEHCPDLVLASPRDPSLRGSQVSFSHPEGYAIMQALIAYGVVGDFRAPDIIRFGFAPLYNDKADVDRAVEVLMQIMNERLWDREEFRKRARVT